MSGGRYSTLWHNADPATFARIAGPLATTNQIVDHDDPVHKARLERYSLNITYYLQAQYADENAKQIKSNNFTELRVNYSSIIPRSINQKAHWLFGEPLGVNNIAVDEEGNPVEKISSEQKKLLKLVKDKTNQFRNHNNSEFWDWVMAIMGMTMGDFFVLVDAEPDDLIPNFTLYEPSFVFPDYPDDVTLPMRACQIQYEVDEKGKPTEEASKQNIRIVEDYRLELKDRPLSGGLAEDPDDLPSLTDEEMKGLTVERLGDVSGRSPTAPEIVCVYRKYREGKMEAGSRREIGIPAIPIVHGLNYYLWQSRYGTDEAGSIIPKLEKYNELFFYAERVARHNSHAKLALKGVRKEDKALSSDYDDVIYLGEKGDASVLTLPSDTKVLEFVTTALDKEMHNDACVPRIAQGEAEVGYGAPSGLALKIRFGPLKDITSLHRRTYGAAQSDVYTLGLLFDEMVIEGQAYGSKYEYSKWQYKFDWWNAMPEAINEIIADMMQATTDTGRGPLVSHRTARERIPGIDPDQEEKRITEETAKMSQASMNAPPPPAVPGDGSLGDPLAQPVSALDFQPF